MDYIKKWQVLATTRQVGGGSGVGVGITPKSSVSEDGGGEGQS